MSTSTPTYRRQSGADICGADERWFVLTCTSCQGLFDVPRRDNTRRLPGLCDDCRKEQKLLYQKRHRAARRG
jgi:hypothetical protein